MADFAEQWFSIDFVGNLLRIRVDSPRAADAVRFLFDGHITSVAGEAAPIVTLLKDAVRGGYRLALGEHVVAPRLDDDELEIALVQLAQYQLVVNESQLAMIHGAALVKNGQGMLLAANAGFGKTTLTSWLLGHGYGFLSDELTAIDFAGVMDGFGRPLNLKPGSVDICQQFNWLRTGLQHSRVSSNVTLLPWPKAATREVPLTAILFPHYQADAAFKVDFLSPGRAASGLMGCLMNSRNLSKNGLSLAVELTKARPCYELVYSNMVNVSDWLESEGRAVRASTP
jgi:hypothetical protein